MMTRGMRLKVLLGACIIGTIGIVVHSNLLIISAVALVLLSCLRYNQTAPTNYTEKFGPADPDESASRETPFNVKLDPEESDLHQPDEP